MNVARGLFRAWILISVLWIIVGGSVIAYKIVAPDTIWGSFQPWLTDQEAGLPPRPDQNQMSRSFSPIRLGRPDMVRIEMPDGSQLYMPESLNEAVRTRIAEQFWDQRWGRWGRAAAILALWAVVPCLLEKKGENPLHSRVGWPPPSGDCSLFSGRSLGAGWCHH
jgi:hypothetical protein